LKTTDMQNFVEQYGKRQSFSYNSFSEARDRLEFGEYFIEFDRFSLLFYCHNMPKDVYLDFLRLSKCLFDNRNIEDKKRRIEYARLFYYVRNHEELYEATIIKAERPDFILIFKGMRIGIEVTELTTESDKLMERISKDYSKKGLSAEELRTRAIDQHGARAKAFTYASDTMHNISLIGSGTLIIESVEKHYCKQILRKVEKYRQSIKEFDRFIILCDAQLGIVINKKEDAQRIFNQLNIQEKILVSILSVENYSSEVVCYEQNYPVIS